MESTADAELGLIARLRLARVLSYLEQYDDALALLGNNQPLGVVLASLLFGTLRNGATRMQVVAGIPIDIISVLQAVILALIAAPAIIRTIYRLREIAAAREVMVSGWGGK